MKDHSPAEGARGDRHPSSSLLQSSLTTTGNSDGDLELTLPRAGVAVVALRGEHDLSTAPELRTLLTRLVARNRLVVVDVSEAEFIDSSVLDTLLNAHRHAEAAFRRVVLQLGPEPIVRTMLEVSGALDLLHCAASREEALASCPAGMVDQWTDEPWRAAR